VAADSASRPLRVAATASPHLVVATASPHLVVVDMVHLFHHYLLKIAHLSTHHMVHTRVQAKRLKSQVEGLVSSLAKVEKL
jgi:hypothetical protein